MKKLLTLLLSVLIVVGLTACNKKDISVNVNVMDSKNEVMYYQIACDKTNLIDILNFASGTMFTYETEVVDGKTAITAINSDKADANEGSYWAVYVNDELVGKYIDDVVLKDGDKVDLIYTSEPKTEIVGAWEVNDGYNALLTDEETEIFNKALEGLTGVGYEPIRVIATQLVSGTNYAFLAKGTTVTSNPTTSYYVLKIYNDLSGNAELKGINEIVVPNIMTKEESSQNMFGSWTVSDTGKAGMFNDEKAQMTFDKAFEGFTGMVFNPVQLLATQLVSGTNYMALCLGKTVTENPEVGLYVVEWHEDLSGNVSLTSVKQFDLEYYLAGE